MWRIHKKKYQIQSLLTLALLVLAVTPRPAAARVDPRFALGYLVVTYYDKVKNSRLYLAAVLDLYSRFIDEGLMHHSDRGSTYVSNDYQKTLRKHGISCSMSRKGSCYDNAVMESWFATFKWECDEHFESENDARREAFDYIEAFYNQRRLHSSLAYLSPAKYEMQARQKMMANPQIPTTYQSPSPAPPSTPFPQGAEHRQIAFDKPWTATTIISYIPQT